MMPSSSSELEKNMASDAAPSEFIKPTLQQIRLIDYLRKPNPKAEQLKYHENPSRSLTYNEDWRIPKEIKEWKEFDSSTLAQACNGIFGEILDFTFESNEFTWPLLKRRDLQFTTEDTFSDLIMKWNHVVVNDALGKSQERCVDLFEPYIRMERGARAKTKKGICPDWAGVLGDHEINMEALRQKPKKATSTSQNPDNRSDNLLPGDSKLGSKWKSNAIEPGQVSAQNRKPGWLKPLCQVFTYCLQWNARYGYIITDKELVALRVTLDEKSPPLTDLHARPSSYEGFIEYAPVPWTEVDENDMTMNLGLWWLHHLARNNKNIEKAYPALRNEPLDQLDSTALPPWASEASHAAIKPTALIQAQSIPEGQHRTFSRPQLRARNTTANPSPVTSFHSQPDYYQISPQSSFNAKSSFSSNTSSMRKRRRYDENALFNMDGNSSGKHKKIK